MLCAKYSNYACYMDNFHVTIVSQIPSSTESRTGYFDAIVLEYTITLPHL